MQQHSIRHSRQQRGSVTILIVLSMIGLLAMAALAVDGGFILTTRAQLQHAADSGALAGIGGIRDGLTTSRALSEAKAVVEDPAHEAGGEPIAITSGMDLVRGTYDLSTGSFTPGTGGSGVTAVRSTVRRAEGSPAGPLQLLLGRVIGLDEVDVQASAIAAVRRRDLVIVQDRTYSFIEEFSDAIAADIALVRAMAGPQALSGDRIGIASFNRNATEDLELVPLDTHRSLVIDTLEDLVVCPNGNAATGCGGTGTGDGIDAGIRIFENGGGDGDAEKVMVLVTDGVPCHNEFFPNQQAAVDQGKIAATAAAQRAFAAGINIYAVTLAIDGIGLCRISQPEFAETLVAGFGYAVATPDPDDLDELLVSIVQQMPVRLVQ